MNDRALSMLGLCARAGKIVTGEKAVVQCIRSGQCIVAVLDGGTAKNGLKAVTQACETHGVPLVTCPENTLGRAIGKPGRMAAAVTDAGLGGRIIELCQVDGDSSPN